MATSNFSCAICVESYTASDDICSTVCGHIFHLKCLQQWQHQSNKCPMCNRSNPEPHRIYLDINGITQRTATVDSTEHNVIIKGLGPSQLEMPPSEAVLWLALLMNIHIVESDIESAVKLKKTLRVAFKSGLHRELFMRNKFKLKNNAETRQVVIHEVLDPVTQALFEYSHKLKTIGYKTIFVSNGKIFVKKEKYDDIPLNIVSKDQVDALCGNSRLQNATNSSQVPRGGEGKRTGPLYTTEEPFRRTFVRDNNFNRGYTRRVAPTPRIADRESECRIL